MKKIKILKTILIPTIGITSIGTIAAVSTSCSFSPVVLVTGVLLDKESLALDVGNTETLIPTVHPEDATDKSVTWSSSDSSVATVDNNGKVTAVGEGQATITVKTNDGGFTATCQVTVNQKIIHVIGVLLNKSSLALGEGDSETLIATVHPDDASDKSVTWSSSDSSVATVDNNGKVYGLSLGSAKITVKTNDGGYEDYCDVTVPRTDVSYICVTANADSTLELINIGENNPNLKYSVDRRIWHDCSSTISIPTDTNLYLRGNNPTGWSLSEQVYSHFNITGNVSISGNVMALLDNGTGTISSIPNDYCFYALFHSSAGITSVSENFLPATELTKYCYDNMFLNCSSLTVVPDLPATTLAEACYSGMFANCTSITNAPTLPATILASYCYFEMFSDCTSLTTAPDLPATTLAESCYYSMFENCKSLTTAPDLPATTLAESCYSFMFTDCASLTTAPDLPATTLLDDCYRAMFYGCSSLTKAPDLPATTLAQGCYWSLFEQCISLATAPDLPATTLAESCYHGMFQGCTSLTTAPYLPAETLANGCYDNMFCDCASLKTATYLPATTLASNCYQGMFSNCSSLTNAPLVLPATTLSSYCYYGMFANCTSLTLAPTLPATTLADSCYWNMFNGCTLLSLVKIGYVGTVSDAPKGAFDHWVDNVNSSGVFYYNGYVQNIIVDPVYLFGFPDGWTWKRY